MGFKSITQYNEDKYKNLFVLPNDGDFADVIFLYSGIQDVLVGDAHYIKSNTYSGYVQCIGDGCPACARNIRPQTKIFVPLFDINKRQVLFWDRTIKFQGQLQSDVFKLYPNPSEFVFRITRHGLPNDQNTTYAIEAINRNTTPLATILADLNLKFPDAYEMVCKDLSKVEMEKLLIPNTQFNGSEETAYTFQAIPRGEAVEPTPVPTVTMPAFNVPTPPAIPDAVPSELPLTEVEVATAATVTAPTEAPNTDAPVDAVAEAVDDVDDVDF